MSTWFISHKRVEKGRITEVQASTTEGSTTGASFTREEVIKWINLGVSVFYTQVAGRRGSKVNVVQARGESYLRTDLNETPADNLGNLPDF